MEAGVEVNGAGQQQGSVEARTPEAARASLVLARLACFSALRGVLQTRPLARAPSQRSHGPPTRTPMSRRAPAQKRPLPW